MRAGLRDALWSCLYLGLFCTLFGFAAWLWALGRLPATEVAAFVFLNPPLANLWAWRFERAPLTPANLAGAAVLLVGVMLIVAAPGRRADGHASRMGTGGDWGLEIGDWRWCR